MNSDQSDAVSAALGKEADRRSLFVLALAAIIGIGLGSLTAADWSGNNDLPGTVVARVNNADIQLLEYHRALTLFASEKRDPISDPDRMLVLERMVEEELLVQHGVNSGLVRLDRGVRTAVVQSIMTGLLVAIEAEANQVISSNNKDEPIKLTTADAMADTLYTRRDAELRAYLGQLRKLATIRWMAGDPGH